MNPTTISIASGILRHVMTATAGYLATTGIIKGEQENDLIAAVIFVGTVAWSWWSKQGRKNLHDEIADLKGQLHRYKTQGVAAPFPPTKET